MQMNNNVLASSFQQVKWKFAQYHLHKIVSKTGILLGGLDFYFLFSYGFFFFVCVNTYKVQIKIIELQIL